MPGVRARDPERRAVAGDRARPAVVRCVHDGIRALCRRQAVPDPRHRRSEAGRGRRREEMPDRHRGPGRSGLLLLLATANRYGYHREVESAATACPVRPVPSSRAIVATSTTTSAIATLREAPEQRRQRRLVVVTPGWVLRGDAEVQLVWLF